MVIVDTSVLIDFLTAKSNLKSLWLKRERKSQRIGITSLTLCEVLQGVGTDALAAKTLDALSHFQIFEIGSSSLAMTSARNYRTLRGLGLTVRNTIDCLIATFCIEEDHTLLHNDRDFDAFEAHLGLMVLDPPESLLHNALEAFSC